MHTSLTKFCANMFVECAQ